MHVPHPDVKWVSDNWTWTKVKPVLRCALAAWLALILFVIPTVQKFMGQASFLILIASILSPPSDPFMSVFEREAIILLFVTLAWAWSCLGIFLANLTRSQRLSPSQVNIAEVYAGTYVEAAPVIIHGVFLITGSCFYSFIKARQGPGPYLFASVFGCICLIISLTTSALFPYPFYTIGKLIVLPLVFHSALAILLSILVFPSSMSAQFTTRLGDVIFGLRENLNKQNVLLAMVRDDEDWYQKEGIEDLSGIPSPSPALPHVDRNANSGLAAASKHKEKTPTAGIPSSDSGSPFSDSSLNNVPKPVFKDALSKLSSAVKHAEGLLTPLATAARLMKSDLVYSRIAPTDFKDVQAAVRRLAVRSDGMVVYWSLVERERGGMGFTTPAASRPNSRFATPGPSSPPSRDGSPERGRDPSHSVTPRDLAENSSISLNPSESQEHESSRSNSAFQVGGKRRHHRHSSHHHLHSHSHHHHNLLQASLHHLTHHMSQPLSSFHIPHRKGQPDVGLFESTRYVFLESQHLSYSHCQKFISHASKILSESCQPLVDGCSKSLNVAEGWVRAGGREDRLLSLLGKIGLAGSKANKQRKKTRQQNIKKLEDTRASIGDVLKRFQDVDRHRVLEPYRPLLEVGRREDLVEGEDIPPHRYLFHCYVYQYHLIRFAQLVCDLLDDIIRIEKKALESRLWTPAERLFRWNIWQASEGIEKEDDENPELVQGMHPAWTDDLDLGLAKRRNPDFLPPKNAIEWVFDWGYRTFAGFAGGNILYAIKAGVLTIIMTIPVFLRNTAGFAYKNKFIWAVIMAQLTLARFRGDTIFGLVARVMSTFLGGILGMTMWYISCGNGQGNAFGLAAVCLVCFPFFFYARLYWPGPPMTNIIFFVTTTLVIGYSYQDVYQPLQSSPGIGFTVAWRRFVLVTSGVAAAGLFSLLPPSTTIRVYQRTTLATTSAEIGAIYCSIVSFANTRQTTDIQEIIGSLTAIRSKLNRSVVLRTNVVYEFSLRGRWPAKRYHKILDIQVKIAYALSHLMSTIERLEPAWTKAFLRRTRFLDADFQGDVLAVISMISTSLRTGLPLPQITPCPLLDRFMAKYHGLNVIHKESEDDYGLPRNLTKETLEDEQYMIFCVGISTAFGIITNLDRLMVATKEIVGEQFHIHGLGGVRFAEAGTVRGGGIELGSRTNTMSAV